MYKLVFRASVKKDIKNIPRSDLEKISADIKNLKTVPLPRGVRKIRKNNYFRIRHGVYRIGYTINRSLKEITIIYIERRSKSTYS
ncbi:MAG: type II toxin-antitoxin system RelE/ParE family toxin [Elusimicrobiota bacterium]|nr:type II toxin-antitoxin system RelE/ParE family toxin [Elusimicrobiota bacterium]